MFNVIPTVKERISTLNHILSLLDKNGELFITVRNDKEFKKINKSNLTNYNDGVVTTKHTFQKYFSEEELIDFILTTNENLTVTTIKNSEYLMIKVVYTS